MLPKKRLIERAIADGSIDRLNRLLSAAHILMCVANEFFEESSDLMKIKGLMLGDIKKKYTNYQYYADIYFKEFASMVDGNKMDMFTDMEQLDELCRKFCNVPKDWKPKEV
jgi:hypothetical protein